MRVEPKPPQAALAAIRAPFLEAGGQPTDPPILQPLGVLLDLAGEELRERLFVVQAEGGEEACLRPDFTIALARAHLESGAADGRYIYEGRAFRAAGPDGFEEFLQLGLEIHQAADAEPQVADAEIAALAWRSASAGGRTDLTLSLGDAGLFGDFLESLGLDPASLRRLKRLAGRPRLLRAELDRSGEPRPASPAVSPPCSPRRPKARPPRCWRRSGRWPGSSRSAAARPRRSPIA